MLTNINPVCTIYWHLLLTSIWSSEPTGSGGFNPDYKYWLWGTGHMINVPVWHKFTKFYALRSWCVNALYLNWILSYTIHIQSALDTDLVQTCRWGCISPVCSGTLVVPRKTVPMYVWSASDNKGSTPGRPPVRQTVANTSIKIISPQHTPESHRRCTKQRYT